MKKRLFTSLLAAAFIALFSVQALAADRYDLICYALTGGGTGALDSYDGANFNDGSSALVVTDGVNYEFRLDASSGAAEASPTVIAPDTNPGTKRWLLQGIRAASIQLATGATPTEFSTDGTLAGNSDTAIPTEKAVKTYVDGVGGLAPSTFPGLVQRATFSYKDTDEIYIGPARYHHKGTAEQIVGWDSQLTYTLSGMSGTDWYYLYLDDTAIVALGSTTLTATELTHSTTEPAWTAAEGGWYNGDDRCIGAFYCSGGNLVEFFHDGGERFFLADDISILSSADPGTDWSTAVTAIAPSFSSIAMVHFYFAYDSNGANAYWRTTGQTGSSGHFIGRVRGSYTTVNVVTDVFTNSSQSIDVKIDAATGDLAAKSIGWVMPRGM